MAFEEISTQLVTVSVDEELARHAGDHAEYLGLRGYDTVHIATALEPSEAAAILLTVTPPSTWSKRWAVELGLSCRKPQRTAKAPTTKIHDRDDGFTVAAVGE